MRMSRCLVGFLGLGIYGSLASHCAAGPLLDWLFGRSSGTSYTAYSAPGTTPLPGITSDGRHVVGYAPGSPYATVPMTNLAPLADRGGMMAPFSYAAGYPNTAAAPAGSCGPGTCYETVLRYLPETSYRTLWAPVPVTQYTTSTSTNPSTGLPITCTRPCTTYSWQARREPYTSFRPVYQQVPLAGDPVYAGAQLPGVSPGNTPVRAFRPFGGFFSRDRRLTHSAPVVATPAVAPEVGAAWGGLLPPATVAGSTVAGGPITAGGTLPRSPTPQTYAYAPGPAEGTGCPSCAGSDASLASPSYGNYTDVAPSRPSGATRGPDGSMSTPWQPVPGREASPTPSDGYGQSPSPVEPDTIRPRLPTDQRRGRLESYVNPPSDFPSTESSSLGAPETSSQFPADPASNQQRNGSTGIRALRDLRDLPGGRSDVPPLLNESRDRTAAAAPFPRPRYSAHSVPVAWDNEIQPERRQATSQRTNVSQDRRDQPNSVPSWAAGTVTGYRSVIEASSPAIPMGRTARATSDSGWHAP